MQDADADELYLRCPHCNVLAPLPSDHALGACTAPLPRACFSCDQPPPPAPGAAPFSARQLARLEAGEPARCARCVAAGATARHVLPPPPPTLSQELEEAVGAVDEARVAALLARGADANAVRQRGVSLGGRWRDLFSPSGAPLPEVDVEHAQPTTPLKLAVFRAADNSLGPEDLARLARVARLLLQHGALAEPALRFMERRHGAFAEAEAQEGGLEVFAVVHAAAVAQAAAAAQR